VKTASLDIHHGNIGKEMRRDIVVLCVDRFSKRELTNFSTKRLTGILRMWQSLMKQKDIEMK